MNGTRRSLLALGLAVTVLLGSPLRGAVAAEDDWPTYHHSADRAGTAAVGAMFNDVQPSWTTGALDGAVYAEPLYVAGLVLVATENNTVYAFDAASGTNVWQSHLADAVPSNRLPCGNIRPIVGITGTPVVDTTSGVLYTAAMISPTAYELYALELASGLIVFHRPLDQVVDPPATGQRGALSIQQGRVYVPFGGRFGDCGNYHGQIIAASLSDPNEPLLTYTTPARRAGIWAPGGLTIAADGTVYAATGNGDASEPEGRTEAVIALSPTLDAFDSWQPTDWQALDRADIDVGSVPPALLSDVGLMFQSGKNGTGYLLRVGALGGLGGEVAAGTVPGGCGGVFGGTAYAPPLLFLPCGSRIVALQIGADPPTFTLAWRGPDATGQPTVGSPIVVAGAVWDIDLAGRLFALDAATGVQRFVTRVPGQPNHFAALAYGGGQIYTATADGVAAFQLVGLTTSTPAATAE
jgi:outer membrane protein assembly factor BamB